MLQFVSKDKEKSFKASPVNNQQKNIGEEIAWDLKYRPKFLNEVPVHYSKVKFIREWVTKTTSISSTSGYIPHVLALCGNSGCCKSTVVELVCKELQVEVIEWHENMWETSLSSSSFLGLQHRTVQNNQRIGLVEHLFITDDTSVKGHLRNKSGVLEHFAMQSKYPSLALAVRSKTKPKEAISLKKTNSTVSLLLDAPCHKLLIVHDPPLVTDSHGRSGGDSLYDFVFSMNCPVVLVLSDGSGRDDFHHSAERCLPRHVKDRVLFESHYFPPVTELKVAKILEKIRKSERVPSSRVNSETLRQISASCLGDVRHAVVQFQFLSQQSSLHRALNPSRCLDTSRPTEANSQRCNSTVETCNSLGTQIDLTGFSSGAESSGSVEVLSPDERSSSSDEDEFDCDSRGRVRAVRAASLDTEKMHRSTHRSSAKLHAKVHKRLKSCVENSSVVSLGVTMQRVAPHAATRQSNNTLLGVAYQSQSASVANSARTEAFSRESSRDLCFSSLHSVAKLLHAKLGCEGTLDFDPDSVIDRSDMGADLIGAFMQWNSVASFTASSRCILFQTAASERVSQSSSSAELDASCDSLALDQLERALSLYSECDVLAARKFDPSSHMDREDSFFPDRYVCATLSRAAAVSKGVGFGSIYLKAKAQGFRPAFQGMRRPKVLDLRGTVTRMRAKLEEVHIDFLSDAIRLHHNVEELDRFPSTESNCVPPPIVSVSELVLHTIPYFRVIREALHAHTLTNCSIFSPLMDWKLLSLSDNSSVPGCDVTLGERSADLDFAENGTDDIVDD